MADERRKRGLVWLGLCPVTVKNLYFWRLIEEVDHKALTKASTGGYNQRYRSVSFHSLFHGH
jgi:hypothetical protein